MSLPHCLLLFRRLDYPGSTLGRGMSFPDCLLLFNRLGCPSNTDGRGVPFRDCLLLFNRLGCLGSTPGKSIPFPDCLLLFNRLGCPGSMPGRDIPFLDYLLLFSPLHYTQSSRIVRHLSHTHTRQPPPYNRFNFLILEQVLQIKGWVFFFFFLGLKLIIYIALFFNSSSSDDTSEFKTKEEPKFGWNCPGILRTICSDQILILHLVLPIYVFVFTNGH